MALNISQFDGVAGMGGAMVPIVNLPPLDVQALATSGTSAQSAALSANCMVVRLLADADMHILIGTNPTATTSHFKLKAGIPEYFMIRGAGKGDLKIAAIHA